MVEHRASQQSTPSPTQWATTSRRTDRKTTTQPLAHCVCLLAQIAQFAARTCPSTRRGGGASKVLTNPRDMWLRGCVCVCDCAMERVYVNCFYMPDIRCVAYLHTSIHTRHGEQWSSSLYAIGITITDTREKTSSHASVRRAMFRYISFGHCVHIYEDTRFFVNFTQNIVMSHICWADSH